LGTGYEIRYKDYDEEPIFEKRSIDGYADNIEKVICICNMNTMPNWENETKEYCKKAEKQILRHEIIHCFLSESGLQESTLQYNGGWAKNEEMIDFFAIQFPKIKQAFEDANCL
jgi:hypothetical protein